MLCLEQLDFTYLEDIYVSILRYIYILSGIYISIEMWTYIYKNIFKHT